MRAYLFLAVLFFTAGIFAADIIPVKEWPTRIGTSVYNPTVDQCVKAGYRLIPATKPATPEGKQIKSEKFVQDEKDTTKCKYEIVYEDIPVKPVPPVIVKTNVASDRVKFIFSTNGTFYGAIWLDAPSTNKAR
jgi:putative hemolysin